ncbi:hypothetical protein P3F01_11215 [Clostridium perfringens]|uniref:hypothetical protein n=1 Tax=Clostridium perfringens TaxID=1502 RepID=UPI0028E12906|nr:hypothetical protein [Clostridium perfringens]MDT9336942.1 hypothetical protein [Clostridium perfringens]MDT9344698.1 hypothetical protein [Clostridium perfringens]MDT9347941.1 hypothetical protein [Clostridium perfringens]MDT9353595.1 hypothetical protein [Clostridium perfringens]
MKNLFLKIKGLLGFCQCDKCWHRAVAELEIKPINKKLNVCEDHMEKILSKSVLKEIFIEVEENKKNE